MPDDLRLRYDEDMRRTAARMFARGRGYRAAAAELGTSPTTVRKWHRAYFALELEGLLAMDKKSRRHRWELKVAARDVAEGDEPKVGVMACYGIASLSPLEKWCRLHREGGTEALGPKPKGRPPGSHTRRAAKTRVQELETENTYLKNGCPESGETASIWDKAQIVAGLSGQGLALADLLEAAGMARSTYYALNHPPRPTRPELWGKAAEVFGGTTNGCGHRQIAT